MTSSVETVRVTAHAAAAGNSKAPAVDAKTSPADAYIVDAGDIEGGEEVVDAEDAKDTKDIDGSEGSDGGMGSKDSKGSMSSKSRGAKGSEDRNSTFEVAPAAAAAAAAANPAPSAEQPPRPIYRTALCSPYQHSGSSWIPNIQRCRSTHRCHHYTPP
jgi:hypothetical protein